MLVCLGSIRGASLLGEGFPNSSLVTPFSSDTAGLSQEDVHHRLMRKQVLNHSGIWISPYNFASPMHLKSVVTEVEVIEIG